MTTSTGRMTGNATDFQEFYSGNLLRTLAIGSSVLGLVWNIPVYLMLIWFEHNRAGHVRTLINQVKPLWWCYAYHGFHREQSEVRFWQPSFLRTFELANWIRHFTQKKIMQWKKKSLQRYLKQLKSAKYFSKKNWKSIFVGNSEQIKLRFHPKLQLLWRKKISVVPHRGTL